MKKNLDLKILKAETEVQAAKAEFKAYERWINGQIPQIPMKEFKNTALRPRELPQQSQRYVVEIWR